MTKPDGTRRRVQILDLRVRLETMVADAVIEACRSDEPRDRYQNKLERRMPFLLCSTPPQSHSEAHSLIQLARHIYAKSSDVMHGRSEALDVPEVLIVEWRQVIERLEVLTGRKTT
ncbi:MAG: hypothetical protein JJT89_02315 [Nitriliruptoraceae bacterium]|nr:hypothetical protein [Nitriliruptoraceae bacterium]